MMSTELSPHLTPTARKVHLWCIFFPYRSGMVHYLLRLNLGEHVTCLKVSYNSRPLTISGPPF